MHSSTQRKTVIVEVEVTIPNGMEHTWYRLLALHERARIDAQTADPEMLRALVTSWYCDLTQEERKALLPVALQIFAGITAAAQVESELIRLTDEGTSGHEIETLFNQPGLEQ